MRLVEAMASYCQGNENAEKAAFEAAMIEKIQTDGLTISDILFDVYQCQKEIMILKDKLSEKKKSR